MPPTEPISVLSWEGIFAAKAAFLLLPALGLGLLVVTGLQEKSFRELWKVVLFGVFFVSPCTIPVAIFFPEDPRHPALSAASGLLAGPMVMFSFLGLAVLCIGLQHLLWFLVPWFRGPEPEPPEQPPPARPPLWQRRKQAREQAEAGEERTP